MNDKNKIVIGNLKMYGSRASNQEHLGLLKKDLNNLKKADVGLWLPSP
jgi:triosephosphate isomerase